MAMELDALDEDGRAELTKRVSLMQASHCFFLLPSADSLSGKEAT